MKQRRKAVRFGLRALFVVLTLICVALAWVANAIHRDRRQQASVARIRAADGAVSYDESFGSRIGYMFPRVSYVEFSGSFGARELEILAELGGVTRLNLRGVSSEPSSFRALAAVCPELEEVYISHAKIGDQHVQALFECQRLRYIDVSHTSVSDAALQCFREHPRLKGFVLSFTNVSDSGMKYLVMMPKLRGVELSGTLVSDKGLSVLANSSTLRVVYVSGTKITEQGVADFDEKNTSCLVVYDRDPSLSP